MVAYVKDNEYADLIPNQAYEIEKVSSNRYLIFKGNPRRYCIGSFNIFHNGKQITIMQAYHLYRKSKKETMNYATRKKLK